MTYEYEIAMYQGLGTLLLIFVSTVLLIPQATIWVSLNLHAHAVAMQVFWMVQREAFKEYFETYRKVREAA
jgi:hypothetical protein